MGGKTPALHLCNIKDTMETSYASIFPETFKMMNIFLVLPISTASVELSFSDLKMIKTRLHSRLSDCSVAQLMRVSIEGLKLMQWNLRKYWRKEHNHRILL